MMRFASPELFANSSTLVATSQVVLSRLQNRFLRKTLNVTLAGLLSVGAMSQHVFPIDAIPTDEEAKQLGLVIQWQAQSQRSETGTGKTGVVLWPSTERREVISVKVGNREVERIDANQVDRVAVEKLVFAENRVSALPKLGIEAARARAGQTVKRYATLGRKATIEEFNQPITYLVTASRDGSVEAFDAESGKVLWSTSVGTFGLPTYGPGVNDKYVAISNGNDLYVLETATGKLVGQRYVSESLGAAPQPINGMIYCSTLSNAVLAFDASNISAANVTSARFSSGVPSPVILSHNQLFVAWPNKNFIYVAEAGRSLSLWNRLVSQDPFVASPQPTDDGYIAVSSAGMVYRISLSRTESIMWKVNLAAQCGTTPLVANGMILVATDTGYLVALSETDGERLWLSDETDVEQPLAITPTRVYAQLKAGQLVSIDRKTGKTLAKINRAFATGLHNDVNDRIVLYSESGSMICMREPDAIYPRLNHDLQKLVETPQKKAPATLKPEADAEAGDPFGSAGEMPKDAESETDPFGDTSEESTTNGDDPFGGF